MCNAIKFKSKREFGGSMRCLLVPLFVLSVFTKVNGAVPNLHVSLSCFKEQVVPTDPNQKRTVLVSVNEAKPFDPIVLKLTISNLANQNILVLSPEFPSKTLSPFFRRTADGKLVPPQVKWSAGLINDYINILPGKTYEVLLYLEELFPFGIPLGAYDVRLKYTPDYKTWVETNGIPLNVAPMGEEEKKEFEEVEAILVAGFAYKPEGVKRFLAKHPNSRHRTLLRLEAARSLIALKEFDSASSVLNTIIADQTANSFKKNRAYWQKGHLLKKMGKLEEAIECMEKSKFRHAYRDAMKWKKEKERSKKKETEN